MPIFRKFNNKALFLSVLIAFSSSAHSAIEWVDGDTVSFHFDSTLAGLFGQPTVVGDSLVFNPADFAAVANNDDGRVLTNETFNIEVMGRNGNNLNKAALVERGDYMLDPLGGGVAFVGVAGQLRAADSTDPFDFLTDGIEAQNPFANTGLTTANWDADAELNLLDMDTNKAILTIENILVAGTQSLLDGAFIEKKQVILTVNAVPVPAAVWFMGTAMLGLLTVGRRSKA